MTNQIVTQPNLPSPYLLPIADEAISLGVATPAVAAWPVANRAFYQPFGLPVNAYVSAISCWCAVTNSANFDVGLYDVAGNRLGSLGSTALAVGVNTWTPANPILLLAGTLYYAAMVAASASSTFARTAIAVNVARAAGFAQQATALPLPATFTLAQMASAYQPLLTLSFRGVPT